LLWLIDTKLGVSVAYIKTQLGIATQVYVVKVKVTVTKNRNSVPLNNFSFLWPIDTKLAVWVAYMYQDAAWNCYSGVCDQGQGHCY